jgi:hypothetical protein
MNKVSIADQRKLDAYLTSVRDVEKNLEREIQALEQDQKLAPQESKALGALGGKLVDFDGKNHTKRTQLMLDVALLAFQTDLTRISTFMFGNERNDINYSFIDGVNTSHHGASHHTESADKLAQYRRICLWHADQVAYVLERMKAIDDGEGTSLLDNSMVFWGGALSDGNSHGRPNLPIMLAGKGGGSIKPGRFIKLKEKTPLCNLYLSMFHRMGLCTPSFADSSGIIEELAG